MLTNSQRLALEILKSKDNCFVSGAAGTGKSYLIDYYRRYFAPNVPIVASTGMAALLVSGRTFHSFFGIGLMNQDLKTTLENVKKNFPLIRRIKNTQQIVIDEVSMLPGLALEYASEICKQIKQNEQPFGGIRVIITGDFFQLPPVTMVKPIDWAFKSPVWQELNLKPVLLNEFMRTTELDFLRNLNEIRFGNISTEVREFLNQKISNIDLNQFEGTRIFSRKNEVDEYNKKRLALIPSPVITLKTIYSGKPEHIERLKKNLVFSDKIELKKDALVMIRINDPKGQFVNGSLGTVESILIDKVIIELLSGEIVSLPTHKFELKDGDNRTLAVAENFPITLAYAITIHKSQGSTIDRAVMDLKRLWEPGQAYTALSRLKSSEGLFLVDWDSKSIFAAKEVIDFYKNAAIIK